MKFKRLKRGYERRLATELGLLLLVAAIGFPFGIFDVHVVSAAVEAALPEKVLTKNQFEVIPAGPMTVRIRGVIINQCNSYSLYVGEGPVAPLDCINVPSVPGKNSRFDFKYTYSKPGVYTAFLNAEFGGGYEVRVRISQPRKGDWGVAVGRIWFFP